jgi:hypothetical protein
VGGVHDAASGLVRIGARFYDPQAGQWLSKDPLGLRAGPNQYAMTTSLWLPDTRHFELAEPREMLCWAWVDPSPVASAFEYARAHARLDYLARPWLGEGAASVLAMLPDSAGTAVRSDGGLTWTRVGAPFAWQDRRESQAAASVQEGVGRWWMSQRPIGVFAEKRCSVGCR